MTDTPTPQGGYAKPDKAKQSSHSQADKCNVAVPVVEIPDTDFKFGDAVTVLLPHKARIWGYTTEHAKTPTNLHYTKTILIVEIDGQAYSVGADDVVNDLVATDKESK